MNLTMSRGKLDYASDGWIGVDLDGTLAIDVVGPYIPGQIGEPIPAMVERVKGWIAQGIEVKIFTARASGHNRDGAAKTTLAMQMTRDVIGDWCEKHIGKRLDITAEKDYRMLESWDDRAIQVVKNTGERVGNVERG